MSFRTYSKFSSTDCQWINLFSTSYPLRQHKSAVGLASLKVVQKVGKWRQTTGGGWLKRGHINAWVYGRGDLQVPGGRCRPRTCWLEIPAPLTWCCGSLPFPSDSVSSHHTVFQCSDVQYLWCSACSLLQSHLLLLVTKP